MRACWFMTAALFATGAPSVSAQEACPPGYTLVEETCYRDVVRCYCRIVPDVKKKSKLCYDVKCVPFCQPKRDLLGCLGCDHCGSKCGSCCKCAPPPECGKMLTKKILMKKVVTTECPGWKCVVEKVCERVPYKDYRMVPCGVRPIVPAELALPAAVPGMIEQSSVPILPAGN